MKKPICKEIEKALGKELCTPKDFDMLRDSIYNRLHILVSATTLKRIWGYLNEEVQTRQGSFDILAQFIGYPNYKDYINKHEICEEELPSSPVLSRKLNVLEDLKTSDLLRIIWQPERQCDVIYLGKQTFRVLSSCNTRIRPNDTFCCGLFIEGEPLYIDNLLQENRPPVSYVCGKKSGIRYEKLASSRATK